MNIDTLKGVAAKAGFRLQKYAPEILTAVGLVGMAGTVVLASRATLHLEPTLEKINDGKAVVKRLHEQGSVSDQELNRELAMIYFRGGFDLLKLYGPSITLGLASFAAIIGAHGIMKRRNVALVAAYKAIETSFKEYRKRVIDEYGEEKDREYRMGVFDEKVTDPETGKSKTVKRHNPDGMSVYARLFAPDTSSNFSKSDHTQNLLFLRAAQNIFNDRLRMNGVVFLNEVYDHLGFDRTTAGQQVGWFFDGRPNREGDNYIDFGIYDEHNTSARHFIHGMEETIWLDFNVDGIVMDRLPSR